MMVWVLRLVVIFALLTAVYIGLGWYMRWLRRQELEAEFTANQPTEDKREYVARGLKRYDRSLRPKLLIGVYALPVLFIVVLLSLANWT